MFELLFRRLAQYAFLSTEEMNAVSMLCMEKPKYIPARRLILDEGDEVDTISYLVRGWACNYKLLEDGRCQILSFYLPGDLWGFGAPVGTRMAHALRTIKESVLLSIPRPGFVELVARYPRLAEAFRWSGLVTDEIARERIVSLGHRKSIERCAHLICEIFWRLRAVGEVDGYTFEFPFTQEEVGDVIGVSTVHANRMLQDLRNENLIRQFGKKLEILNLADLQRLALFNPSFLHLNRPVITASTSLALPASAVIGPSPYELARRISNATR